MIGSKDTILVGAVAYHERIVPIWEAFSRYFTDAGVATDYVLYSNYERLVEALLARDVTIAWNTNTAYVQATHRAGHEMAILGMRDVDATYASVIATRKGQGFETPKELAGRRLALGSRDSGHAAILPLRYLLAEGLDAVAECELVRFDTDMGKHGDTGDSELRVLEAIADGLADAGAVGDATWIHLKGEGWSKLNELELSWRSPTYYHCNFTAHPDTSGDLSGWANALLAMSYDDHVMRHPMDLEGVKKWLPGDDSGYADLRAAMHAQGYLK
jgi:ABC-type phosphate/phosphonate transport system substrate-binding protein